MTAVYPIVTVEAGIVTPGAVIQKFHLKNANMDVPAVVVGNRSFGAVTVELLEVQQQGFDYEVSVTIKAASVGITRNGFPRFTEQEKPTNFDEVIVVFRTPAGENPNDHTGDRMGWRCKNRTCAMKGEEKEPPYRCPSCESNTRKVFANCPGKILAGGTLMKGKGTQLIVQLPKGSVIRTFYCGEFNGSYSHYYMWNGKELLTAVWEDRIERHVF